MMRCGLGLEVNVARLLYVCVATHTKQVVRLNGNGFVV